VVLSQVGGFRGVVVTPSPWYTVEVGPFTHAVQGRTREALGVQQLELHHWDDPHTLLLCASEWHGRSEGEGCLC
jgi:hypothetical protein